MFYEICLQIAFNSEGTILDTSVNSCFTLENESNQLPIWNKTKKWDNLENGRNVNEEVDEGGHDPVLAGEGREDLAAVLENRIWKVLLTVRVDAESAPDSNEIIFKRLNNI